MLKSIGASWGAVVALLVFPMQWGVTKAPKHFLMGPTKATSSNFHTARLSRLRQLNTDLGRFTPPMFRQQGLFGPLPWPIPNLQRDGYYLGRIPT